jgi:CobQ-like glutamine amidotransferase family enzyme
MNSQFNLTIGWLYPDLMSTYGDRGNVLVLKKKCEWNNITVKIQPINQTTTLDELKKIDFVFGGGSQDLQQEIVMRDLMGKKGRVIKELIENNVPALFVCGSPQLMGKYYEPAVGKRIEGLGIFDMVSKNPGLNKPRCIGNIIGKVNWESISGEKSRQTTIVGFENHGGRTYLGNNVKPFAYVLHGFGNNGEDGTEGVVYKNAIGCYFHGPLLPKNPEIADYLIQKSIEVKYKKIITLASEKDILAEKARSTIQQRYNVK